MSACEWCWRAASERVMYSGGSVTERYREVLHEQDELGLHAGCLSVREFHELERKVPHKDGA